MQENLIKKKRKEKKLTQAQISKELHISRIAIAQYEAKKRFPTGDILEPYSRILGITIDDYYHWYNNK